MASIQSDKQTGSEEEQEHRYEFHTEPSKVVEHVKYIFDNNPVSKEIDIDGVNWEVEWVDIDEIDAETEDHKEESNVALYERRVAVEKAQLTVGEGHPLIVQGDDNVLIEGFARYEVLRKNFDDIETEVPVYRAVEPDT